MIVHKPAADTDADLRMLEKRVQKPFDVIRLHPVVRIDEPDKIARRRVDPVVARGGYAAVRLVNDLHPLIARRVRVADSRAAVIAAVVHEKDLDRAVRLNEQAVETVLQIRLGAVHRHDDADPCRRSVLCRLFHRPFSFHAFVSVYQRRRRFSSRIRPKRPNSGHILPTVERGLYTLSRRIAPVASVFRMVD